MVELEKMMEKFKPSHRKHPSEKYPEKDREGNFFGPDL
jgi:hypothetical protein